MDIHESYIVLNCVDLRFQRNLNQTLVQRIGNALETRFSSTKTKAT